jgi:hypothetical protein
MYASRRRLLFTSATGLIAFFLRAAPSPAADLTVPQGRVTPSPRREDPEDPANGLPAGATKKAALEQHQKDIKRDIEKLFDLATQLKTEVEKTDATTVLSLEMIRKAEEIEKLARQIKDHAKGA